MRTTVYRPKLQFRYYIEFLDYPDWKYPYYAGNAIDLPKWTIENQWKNPISLKIYTFEMVQAIETQLIKISKKPLENKIRINLLHPDCETINGFWDILGNIEIIDFGHLTWKNDDVISIQMDILPFECTYTNLIKEPIE